MSSVYEEGGTLKQDADYDSLNIEVDSDERITDGNCTEINQWDWS